MGVPSGDRAPKDMLEEFKSKVKGCKTFPVEKLLKNPKFVTECKDKLTPDLQNISSIQVCVELLMFVIYETFHCLFWCMEKNNIK